MEVFEKFVVVLGNRRDLVPAVAVQPVNGSHHSKLTVCLFVMLSVSLQLAIELSILHHQKWWMK